MRPVGDMQCVLRETDDSKLPFLPTCINYWTATRYHREKTHSTAVGSSVMDYRDVNIRSKKCPFDRNVGVQRTWSSSCAGILCEGDCDDIEEKRPWKYFDGWSSMKWWYQVRINHGSDATELLSNVVADGTFGPFLYVVALVSAEDDSLCYEPERFLLTRLMHIPC